MKSIKMNINLLISAVLLITLISLVSCGGGGSSLPAVNPGNQTPVGPQPGTSDLTGTLVQGSADRVVSQQGAGLSGVLVSLINTLTGQLAGMDATDSMGKFEFKGVPSGDSYLVKIEFTSSEDLDGDGQPDEIELYFPVSLADQAVVDVLQQIGVTDSDGDGQLDAVEIEYDITDDDGNHEQNRRQHRRRSGETVDDSDNDGSFDDEVAESDSDADGLIDDDGSNSSDDSSGFMELEIKGVIEEITSTYLKINGYTFSLTNATSWRIDDNRNVDPAMFTVGMFVEVEGLSDGQGGYLATKVKSEDDHSSGDDSSTEDSDDNDDSDDDSDDSDDNSNDSDDDDDSTDDNSSDDDSDDSDMSDDDQSGSDDDSSSGSDEDTDDTDDSTDDDDSDNDVDDDGSDDNDDDSGNDDDDESEDDN